MTEQVSTRIEIQALDNDGLSKVLSVFLLRWSPLQSIAAEMIYDCFVRRQEGSMPLMAIDPNGKYLRIHVTTDTGWEILSVYMIIAPNRSQKPGEMLVVELLFSPVQPETSSGWRIIWFTLIGPQLRW